MIRILTGDCRDVLPTLEANSVHCVVTSPPYYGLRDYGTAQWQGGDAGCDHKQKPEKRGNASYTNGQGGSFASNLQAWGDRDVSSNYRDTCGKCGARRIDRQIGLEATPDEYIQTMVEVFREVKRVLRPDGTCWVNMGDSYAASGGFTPEAPSNSIQGRAKQSTNCGSLTTPQRRLPGTKPKDLLLMPARLALALQADGWWLRSDIIWAKPNPMPESCRDRPTSAHEHVFLLTKRSRYFYDSDGVREDAEYGYSPTPQMFNGIGDLARGPMRKTGGVQQGNGGTRNLRNVWQIATHAFPQAHFATFAPELAERCIRAGTSERGCCAQCGKLWVRESESRIEHTQRIHTHPKYGDDGQYQHQAANRHADGHIPGRKVSTTTGWRPGCQCNVDTVPCTVLDPFSGAGTALLVADRLGRDAIGIDLSHAYVEMARERLRADCPLFADITDAPVASEDAYDRDMRDLFAEAAE